MGACGPSNGLHMVGSHLSEVGGGDLWGVMGELLSQTSNGMNTSPTAAWDMGGDGAQMGMSVNPADLLGGGGGGGGVGGGGGNQSLWQESQILAALGRGRGLQNLNPNNNSSSSHTHNSSHSHSHSHSNHHSSHSDNHSLNSLTNILQLAVSDATQPLSGNSHSRDSLMQEILASSAGGGGGGGGGEGGVGGGGGGGGGMSRSALERLICSGDFMDLHAMRQLGQGELWNLLAEAAPHLQHLSHDGPTNGSLPPGSGTTNGTATGGSDNLAFELASGGGGGGGGGGRQALGWESIHSPPEESSTSRASSPFGNSNANIRLGMSTQQQGGGGGGGPSATSNLLIRTMANMAGNNLPNSFPLSSAIPPKKVILGGAPSLRSRRGLPDLPVTPRDRPLPIPNSALMKGPNTPSPKSCKQEVEASHQFPSLLWDNPTSNKSPRGGESQKSPCTTSRLGGIPPRSPTGGLTGDMARLGMGQVSPTASRDSSQGLQTHRLLRSSGPEAASPSAENRALSPGGSLLSPGSLKRGRDGDDPLATWTNNSGPSSGSGGTGPTTNNTNNPCANGDHSEPDESDHDDDPDQSHDHNGSLAPNLDSEARGAGSGPGGSLRAKQSTRPRSVAERIRRERISVRLQRLKDVMPRTDARIDTAAMLEDAVTYIRSLQTRCRTLEITNAAMQRQMEEARLQGEIRGHRR